MNNFNITIFVLLINNTVAPTHYENSKQLYLMNRINEKLHIFSKFIELWWFYVVGIGVWWFFFQEIAVGCDSGWFWTILSNLSWHGKPWKASWNFVPPVSHLLGGQFVVLTWWFCSRNWWRKWIWIVLNHFKLFPMIWKRIGNQFIFVSLVWQSLVGHLFYTEWWFSSRN